jgi:uncharacterized protein
MRYITPPQQIVLAGDEPGAFVDHLRRRFLPNYALLRAGDVPAASNMTTVDGRAAAYVCENFTCKLPAVNPADLDVLLK